MEKVYVIKRNILFWPDRNLLSDQKSEIKSVQLTGSSSRCLELLLSKAELVTQGELYEYAWQGSGFTPSPNTLYQSISILRRAFKKLDGSSDKFILTETRKGFIFNPQIPTESYLKTYTQEDDIPPQEENITHKTSYIEPRKSNNYSWWGIAKIALTVLICFFMMTFLIFPHVNGSGNKNIMSTYKKTLLTEKSGCIFFLSPHTPETSLKNISLSHLSCNQKPFNYVTTHSYSPHISIISCNKEFTMRPDNCSVLFLRGKE